MPGQISRARASNVRYRGRGRLHESYSRHPYHPSNRPPGITFDHLKFAGKFIGAKVAALSGWKRAFGSYTYPLDKIKIGPWDTIPSVDRDPNVQPDGLLDISNNMPGSRKRQRTHGSSSSIMPVESNMSQLSQQTGSTTRLLGMTPLPRHYARTKTCNRVSFDNEVTPVIAVTSTSAYGNLLTQDTDVVDCKNIREMILNYSDKEYSRAGFWTCMNLVCLPNIQSKSDSATKSTIRSAPFGLKDIFNPIYSEFVSDVAGYSTGQQAYRSMYDVSITNGKQNPVYLTGATSTTTGAAFGALTTTTTLTALESIKPGDIRFQEVILDYSTSFMFLNSEVYTQDLEIFVCVPKRDTDTAFSEDFRTGMLEQDNFTGGTVVANYKAFHQHPWMFGSYPTESRHLNNRWKIVDKKKVVLAPGGQHTHYIKKNTMLINSEVLQDTSETSMKGMSFTVFARCIGRFGTYGATGTSRGTLARLPGRVYVVQRERVGVKSLLGVVPVAQHFNGAQVIEVSGGDPAVGFSYINPTTNSAAGVSSGGNFTGIMGDDDLHP